MSERVTFSSSSSLPDLTMKANIPSNTFAPSWSNTMDVSSGHFDSSDSYEESPYATKAIFKTWSTTTFLEFLFTTRSLLLAFPPPGLCNSLFSSLDIGYLSHKVPSFSILVTEVTWSYSSRKISPFHKPSIFPHNFMKSRGEIGHVILLTRCFTRWKFEDQRLFLFGLFLMSWFLLISWIF